MTAQVQSLNIQPGIQRDGTLFDAPCFVDGQWVRFQRGRPRKIGGYRGAFLNAPQISRGMVMQSQQGINYVYSGSQTYLKYWQTGTNDGVGSGPYDVTPSTGFTANANNLWQFDIGYNSSATALQIVAHPGQNLTNIDSTVTTRVLSGTFPGGTLTPVGVFSDSATINSTSTTMTVNIADFRIAAGQTITAASGIPANTTVVSALVSGSTTIVVMSAAATASTTQSTTFDNNISVSGGACMIYPYLFVYGSNGQIQNSSAGDFTNWVGADANYANVSSTKVVKGMPLRGGTTSPAALFWSLDQLTRVSYAPQTIGSATIYWRYDIISTQTSILSSQCVIEYDGIYYWVGVDRFLQYNGIVQEIKNNNNINFFFDNLNYNQRQKVWAAKIPRWGEIWWFYPSGTSIECDNAIIYNVRDNIWYDAGFAPGAHRSAGVFSEVFKFPIWADTTPNVTGTYTLWQHETGTDSVYLNNVDAIESYFETNSIGWVTGGPGVKSPSGNNRWIRIERIEPDFVQSGQMSVVITGKSYADDADVPSDPYNFTSGTLKIDMREQRREMRLRFISNDFNGNYETGNILLSADIGDERGTGNP